MSLPKILLATRWLNLLDVDGWVFASRRRPGDPKVIDAVNIIAWHRQNPGDPLGRLVVIEEFRKPIGQWEFSLPAGLLEKNESIADCGSRELKEETGLDVTVIDFTSGETFSSAGISDESQAFISVQCQGTPNLKPGVGGEKIRVHFLGQQASASLLEKNRQGKAAISARLWPILVNIAQAGSFAQTKVAP
jgi:ADP-ribose pyrophosphatase